MRKKLDEDCFCTVLVVVDSLIKNGKSHECSEKIATLLILINSYYVYIYYSFSEVFLTGEHTYIYIYISNPKQPSCKKSVRPSERLW